MFYVITCNDRALRRVVTSKYHAVDICKKAGMAQCIVSGYDEPEAVYVTKALEQLDSLYLQRREKKPELLEETFKAFGDLYVHMIQLSISCDAVLMHTHVKGPGMVVAVQLEDDEE